MARYDGFIEKFAGDGALILFGVPQAHEDDPVRAIRAAREIHDCVDAISPLYDPRLGRRLTMHSGINTGLAVTADVNTEKGTHGVTGEAMVFCFEDIHWADQPTIDLLRIIMTETLHPALFLNVYRLPFNFFPIHRETYPPGGMKRFVYKICPRTIPVECCSPF